MSAKSGDPKKISNLPIPADHKAPVRRQSPEPCPAFVNTDPGKCRDKLFDLLCQQLLDRFVNRRIPGRQLLLIASAQKQSLTLRPEVNVMAYVPDKRPFGIDPIE